MKISSISFKGYKESGTDKIQFEEAREEIKKARPYLKLMGDSLPIEKDIFLKVENDGADDVFTVDIVDNKTKKSSTLSKEIDHEILGFWFLEDTFKGLANHSKEIFGETAKNFCLNISHLERDLDPAYKEWIKDIAEVAAHPCDYCC